ncbi:histidine--tRNA ligase [Pseudoalteromonas maricaloris]|uniref:histidine--tRNA ligase n=1 Tax=Pseudoalteromonas maricaloris TaxID=184924 RepID=UPI00029AA889|nr:histidine--tRNA ligase [Pseudoalteromonas flavipulchra]
MSKKIYKPKPTSGFPEWLPEQRAVELKWLDIIRAKFESYGFCSIETSAVEKVETLLAKGGDADKEIYSLKRLHDIGQEETSKVALHYDLTVPLARYIAINGNNLTFPFKRYQIQKCWRGERPQEGRFREFCQCDIDVLDQESVSVEYDAELPKIIYEIIEQLEVGPVNIHINNRKVLEGFYQGLGIEDITSVISIVDKIDKLGIDMVGKMLSSELSLPKEVVSKCLELATIKTFDNSFLSKIRSLGVESETLNSGLEELSLVLERLSDIPEGVVIIDLSIARGFDYYTGTVYEGKLANYPDYPTIFAGGRYENLVGSFTNKRIPGVGISIGITRIISKLFKENAVKLGPKCPTTVLVAQLPGLESKASRFVAHKLRSRGYNVEVFHDNAKLNKQIKYADKKGIPYVWFPSINNDSHEVKNLKTGEQIRTSVMTWLPDESMI